MRRLERRDYTALWKVLLFRPGLGAGAPSVEALLEALRFRSLEELLPEWCGTFGLFIFNKKERRWLIASDHLGLYRIFLAAAAASTSFLDLCAVRAGPDDIDREGVEQFLLHGGLSGRGTFVRGIQKLRYDEVLELGGAAGESRRLRKRLAPVGGYDPEAVWDYFRALTTALCDEKVSVDLTGGFDSRVTACLLANEGLDFEVALSAEPGSLDAAIAGSVASALGRRQHGAASPSW